MSLKAKWHARQMALEVLSYVLCATTVIVAVVAIRASNFMEHGLGMYPGVRWPKGFGFQDALRTFWEWSVWPLAQWLPVALVADAALRRFVYGLRR